MNRSFEILKDLYKPYRYRMQGKATILETTTGNVVVKEKCEKDYKDLYAYLSSRNFLSFPALLDESRSDFNVFEYIEDAPSPKEQKALDLMSLVSNLHNKTSYFKEVSEDNYKEIYENIDANIQYRKESYERIYEEGFREKYMSPSVYSFMRHSSKLFAALDFAKKELDDWYELVKPLKRQRVALVHNKLELSHYIKGEKEALISWETSKIDTPILDLVHFYQKEYFDLDFDSLLHKYFETYPLKEEEKKLFFILISLPPELEKEENEFSSCNHVRHLLDYIYKTENLIRPYYTVEQEKE